MVMKDRGIPLYGGKYVQYNILGNLFQVSSKYVPPLQPIGRGAYGIVWYNFFSIFFSFLAFGSKLCREFRLLNFLQLKRSV